MGYEIVFKNIPEEELDYFNEGPAYYTSSKLNECKYEIIEQCMKYKDILGEGHISTLFNVMSHKIDLIVRIQERNAKSDFFTEYNIEGKYTICGSEYRNNDFDENENEELKEYCVSQLLTYGALVDTPDFWDDLEKWEDKYRRIEEVVDYAISQSYINMVGLIKMKLYKYSDEYEEHQKVESEIEEK